jgi:hypothetical protein
LALMTLAFAEIHELILGTLQRLQDDGGQLSRAIARKQLSRAEFWLLGRLRYFPASVTPGDFKTYGPYTSTSIYEQSLAKLADQSLVERVETSRYRSTDAGRKLITKLYRDYFRRIAKHDFLPAADVQRLGALADRVLSSALHQPNLHTPITEATTSVFPAIDEAWVMTERRLVAITAFRDDAHIAAWREEGWSGPEIALSTALFYAPDGLNSAQLREATATLNDKDFKSALSALYSSAEVAQHDDHYVLSTTGRTSREKIEAATNHNYSLPFGVLEPIGLEELVGLLEKARGPQAA